ncbi:hypothetical protein EIP86_008450 [Pleurotus ostreatoroseus]|nr:hypothetical protein EIP86_008450 [Pleurotus ostreatoroseus]
MQAYPPTQGPTTSSGASTIEKKDTRHLLLPVEILEKIFKEAWAAPLTIDERITLFTSLCLANRGILSVFVSIAFRDVHVLTPNFTSHYLWLLATRASSERNDQYLLNNASSTINELCRTLTFHVDAHMGVSARHSDANPDSASGVLMEDNKNREIAALCEMIYQLEGTFKDCVPHLRRIAIQFYDWGYHDFFDQCRTMPLPAQVTELELRYVFSPALRLVAHGLRRQYGSWPGRNMMSWETPFVQKLIVHGASALFVSDVLTTTGNVHTLEVDDCVKLTQMKPLPESVKTVILRTAVPPKENAGADSWSLVKALKAGKLFDFGRELDFVLKDAGTNARSRERLRKASHAAGVRLRFED